MWLTFLWLQWRHVTLEVCTFDLMQISLSAWPHCPLLSAYFLSFTAKERAESISNIRPALWKFMLAFSAGLSHGIYGSNDWQSLYTSQTIYIIMFEYFAVNNKYIACYTYQWLYMDSFILFYTTSWNDFRYFSCFELNIYYVFYVMVHFSAGWFGKYFSVFFFPPFSPISIKKMNTKNAWEQRVGRWWLLSISSHASQVPTEQ